MKWRIGSFTHDDFLYNTGDRLESVKGLNASLLSYAQEGKKYTEKIEIFATKSLNGTPIECMYAKRKSAKYSMFAVLNVVESHVQTEEG